MTLIDDEVLKITKNDDVSFSIIIKDSLGQEYVIEDGDKLTITVRELPTEDSPILLQATTTTNTFDIPRSMTNIPAGRYTCDIQLDTRFGKRYTVFPIRDIHGYVRNEKNFIVDPEVT